MPDHKDLKRLVRTRMTETRENYTQALSAVLSSPALEPVPAPWHISGTHLSGTHRGSYQAGLTPSASSHHGSRVVRLRLRPGIAERRLTSALPAGRQSRTARSPTAYQRE